MLEILEQQKDRAFEKLKDAAKYLNRPDTTEEDIVEHRRCQAVYNAAYVLWEAEYILNGGVRV